MSLRNKYLTRLKIDLAFRQKHLKKLMEQKIALLVKIQNSKADGTFDDPKIREEFDKEGAEIQDRTARSNGRIVETRKNWLR